ncbi:LysR family transcriptional regulator [Vibrio sp. PP-XX7]
MFSTTLEQWQILKSVIESGSIAKAAKLHHKSQPAISYQLAQLQERLGIELLQLQGRRLILTNQGSILLDEVSVILESWKHMEHKAMALKSDTRSVISLVVDSLYPRKQLFEALKQFNQAYPHTQVHIREVVRDEGVSQIEKESGDLYLVGLPSEQHLPASKQFVMHICFMLVAHQDHPIFQVEEHLAPLQLASYPVIQIVDKENQQRQIYQKKYQESWYATTIDSAIEAVMSGLSCGWLPENNIRPFLDAGILLPVQEHAPSERISSLYLVTDLSRQYDPCIQSLTKALLGAVNYSS